MPLASKSLNFGSIALGFFNIESDMLLLERYFFFASDFCETIDELADRCGTENVSLPLSRDSVPTRLEPLRQLPGSAL